MGPASPLPALEILAEPDGAPSAYQNRDQLPASLSLGHSGNTAVCVQGHEGARLGCDPEKIEQRRASFEETWFTPNEIEMLGDSRVVDRAERVSLIWCAKESVLEAIRKGLSADTRRVQVVSIAERSGEEWGRIEVRDEIDGQVYLGWWKSEDGVAFTILSDQETSIPILLGPGDGS